MELNAEQIVKALECCSSGGKCSQCSEDEKNPRLTKEGCMAVQMRNAIALINKLTEENERLREITERTIVAARMNDMPISEGLETVYKYCDKRKADTVREFAERLRAEKFHHNNFGYLVYLDDIDQIAKEMLEGKTSHFYYREAEKNLRLLNEARGVVWHSVEEELPSENGTYLVVGKSGTVCTAHFYPEHKIPSTEYAIIPGHFSNRHVRFWAKLPEPPIPDQDYQHTDNK